MHEVQSNPLKGAKDLSGKFKLRDERWNHKDGWIKMARNVKGVEIHFVYNKKTGMFDDFKYAIN